MGKRLFIALELPESCRERLLNVGTAIRGVRWLTADQLHLTLAFLGDVSEEAERTLQEKLAEVRVPPFVLPIHGVGTFGGLRPSVIWAGAGTDHPHLFALHRRVHDALLAARFDLEVRRFHPHVTLARLKDVSAQTLRPFLRQHESDDFCLVEVTSFALVSSKPGPEGSTYAVERRYDLKAPLR
jgi:2'-5' RNA ligase